MGQLAQPKKDAFLDAVRSGSSIVEAAAAAHIPRSTLYRHRRVDEAFAAEWDEAFDDGADALEQEAQRRALDGSDTLLIFLLKSRRPQRFAHFERVQVTGADGGPVEVEHKGGLTLADVARFAHTDDGPSSGAR